MNPDPVYIPTLGITVSNACKRDENIPRGAFVNVIEDSSILNKQNVYIYPGNVIVGLGKIKISSAERRRRRAVPTLEGLRSRTQLLLRRCTLC